MLSRSFFDRHPEDFFDFYRERMLAPDALPSKAHTALAKLEQMGKLTAVITQNIDGLHQKTGSQTVYELHGSTLRNYCMDCHAFYPLEFIQHSCGVPRCPICQGIVKPDVVLYEEGLDDSTITAAVTALAESDLVIVGGTSLTVYPAAGLIGYRGGKLAVINKTATPADRMADLCLHQSVGEALTEALSSL